jgi:DNA modification methylase
MRDVALLAGDATTELAKLYEQGPRFALAYLDPPFYPGGAYRTADGELAFEGKWRSIQAYLDELVPVVRLCRELLIPEGSLVLHVDPKSSHYAKVRLDELFGERCFASEIIWRYRRWPSKTRNFQRVHDVLLRYVRERGAEHRFTQLYEPLSPKTVDVWGQRKQRAVLSDGTRGKARRMRSSTTAERSPGAPLGDVWDIGIIAPSSRERTGYPTQKPEALLERLVSALTLPGDHVLDPYAGSGTTLAVCDRLGRGALGIDSSPVAVRYATQRLGGEMEAAS